MNKGELFECFRQLSVGFSVQVCAWLLPQGAESRCSDLERAVAWLRLFYRFGGVAGCGVTVESFKSAISAPYVAYMDSFVFHPISKCSEVSDSRSQVLADCSWVAMASVTGVRGVLVWESEAAGPVFIGKGYSEDGSIRDFSRILSFKKLGGSPDGTLVLDVRLMLGVPMYVLGGLGFRGYASEKDLIRVLLGLDDARLAEVATGVEQGCGESLFKFSLIYPVMVGGVDLRKSVECGWGMYDEVIRRYGMTFGWSLVAVPRCCGDLGVKQRFKGYVWGLGHSGVLYLPLHGSYGCSSLSARWYYDCVSVHDTGSRHVLCQVLGCYDYGVRREWVLGYFLLASSVRWVSRVCAVITTNISSRPAYLLLGQIVEVTCHGCHEDGILINPVIQRVRFDLSEDAVHYAGGIQTVFEEHRPEEE